MPASGLGAACAAAAIARWWWSGDKRRQAARFFDLRRYCNIRFSRMKQAVRTRRDP
ncbi:hypothetical protein EXIGLDRAFT_721812 [Exidia glandulosa HHB12029]|uniref:Uncharacterized protein n=1 Tax=Exidia glandulosa HHB12029 TaxID=1314781 RepID=A0A165QHK3_EXIGL|nr:hypothetical protein EXIGLDRAFT_721812 [Exidia glandulosa HHB12029]